MKIIKYGAVTISQDGAAFSGFCVDAEGHQVDVEEIGKFIMEWAISRIAAELDEIVVIDGGNNTWNGKPLHLKDI